MPHSQGRWERVLLSKGPDGAHHEQIVCRGRGVLLIQHDGSPEGCANAAVAVTASELLDLVRSFVEEADDRLQSFPLAGESLLSARARQVIASAEDANRMLKTLRVTVLNPKTVPAFSVLSNGMRFTSFLPVGDYTVDPGEVPEAEVKRLKNDPPLRRVRGWDEHKTVWYVDANRSWD